MTDKYKDYYNWQVQEENNVSDVIDQYDYVDIECIFSDRTSSILAVNWNESSYSWTDDNGEEFYEEYCSFYLIDENGDDVSEDKIVYWRIVKEKCV